MATTTTPATYATNLFIPIENKNFDCYITSLFLSKKKEEGVEEFYSDKAMRDLFISNLLDNDIPRQLLRKTVQPDRTVNIALNMEIEQLAKKTNIKI